MATSEIEKLERRYAENPHGLTFAPLAEVHRKNGDLARALELLTAGLELHPNYIPASIVLGRCHQDLADLPSAEAAFAHVLRLDDENVIALKSLADINERLERFGEAETWLRRLVSIDRSNDEAREQLHRIEIAQQGERVSDAEAATAEPPPVLEMIDFTPEPAVAQSPQPASSPAELPPVDIAAMDLNRPVAEQSPGYEVASRVEAPAEPTPAPADAALVEQEGEAPSPPPPMADEPAVREEAVHPLPGLISAEFQPPLEATGGLGVETSEEVVLEVSGESEFRVPDASEDLRSLAGRLNSPTPVAPAERQREAVPTREPASRRGAELEFVVTEAEAEQPAKRPSYDVAETKGQSVAAFFRALVAARPPSEPGSSGSASTSHRGDGAPERPARDSAADGAVSFDDFFNSEADGATPRRNRNAEPGKDDLDQFQSWLQNLKR